MDADVAYFVTYPCPQCRVGLEAEHGLWQGWLKCPACGRPALPPEILLGHPSVLRRIRDRVDDEAAMALNGINASPAAEESDPPAEIAASPSTLVNTLRLVFLSGVVTSLFLLLIAYLDQNLRASFIFGCLAVVFFVFLLRLPSRRRGNR